MSSGRIAIRLPGGRELRLKRVRVGEDGPDDVVMWTAYRREPQFNSGVVRIPADQAAAIARAIKQLAGK